jgi:hypothetical protein
LLLTKLFFSFQIPWFTNNLRGYNKNKIKIEKGGVTADITEIPRTIGDYTEQLCPNKSDNPEEMDKFLEICILSIMKKMKTQTSHNHYEDLSRNKKFPLKENPRTRFTVDVPSIQRTYAIFNSS